VKVPEIEFDWDEANIGHVARHSVLPEEAEQVIINDPVDLGMEIVEGEERYLNLGVRCNAAFFSWLLLGAKTGYVL